MLQSKWAITEFVSYLFNINICPRDRNRILDCSYILYVYTLVLHIVAATDG